jgi:hypothetical protein
VSTNIDRLKTGNFSNFKLLRSGVSELKINYGKGIKLEDAEILDTDFSEYYANYLKKNPKKLKNYKKHIITE